MIAAPSREPAWLNPCAKARSVGSIQRDSALVAMGKVPDSLLPKRNPTVTADHSDSGHSHEGRE